MDEYTEKTKRWLEERYNKGVAEGNYRAHRPIYGFGKFPSEPSHTNRFAISLSLLRVLNRIKGTTLIDLGGGEGYIAALARDIFGYESMLQELPEAACQRARELFGLPADSSDVHSLPYADNSVDVVLLSEVVEHLRDPFRAIAEAWRVTKNVLIISTQETYPWRWERMARHYLRDLNKDHAERNHFHPDDFHALFGNSVELLNPCLVIPLEDERKIDEKQAKKLVPYLAKPLPFLPGSFGILAVVQKKPSDRKLRVDDETLVEKLFEFRVPLPNVSRAKEVPKIKWPKHRERFPSESDPLSPLAETWNPQQRKHIDHVSSLFATPTRTGRIAQLYFLFLILLSAGLRFVLSPGSIGLKLRWLSRTVDKRRLHKLFGG
jgi:SAM-dependent methyltransferase